MYGSKTFINITKKKYADNCKNKPKIVVRYINKREYKDGNWRLLPNQKVFKQVKSIPSKINRKGIALFGLIVSTE